MTFVLYILLKRSIFCIILRRNSGVEINKSEEKISVMKTAMEKSHVLV